MPHSRTVFQRSPQGPKLKLISDRFVQFMHPCRENNPREREREPWDRKSLSDGLLPFIQKRSEATAAAASVVMNVMPLSLGKQVYNLEPLARFKEVINKR